MITKANKTKRIFKTIIFCLTFLAFVYVGFMGKMISNIVQRRTLDKEYRTLVNEVNDLELTYLSMSEKIDLSLSKSYGFFETNPEYASRKSLGAVFSLKNEI